MYNKHVDDLLADEIGLGREAKEVTAFVRAAFNEALGADGIDALKNHYVVFRPIIAKMGLVKSGRISKEDIIQEIKALYESQR